eukprot:749043-Hanusia_phi.AAC.1
MIVQHRESVELDRELVTGPRIRPLELQGNLEASSQMRSGGWDRILRPGSRRRGPDHMTVFEACGLNLAAL